MTSWSILKITLYLDSTLSKLFNDTKITQNGVWMKKLWSKQNKSPEKRGAAKKKNRRLQKFTTVRKFTRLQKFQQNFFF